MEKINIQQICSFKININSICTDYIYKKRPKYFTFLFPKEGFYYKWCIGSPRFVTKEEIENQGYYLIEGLNVFHLPHIHMIMSNQCRKTKYFKTEDELKEFIDTYLIHLNIINF